MSRPTVSQASSNAGDAYSLEGEDVEARVGLEAQLDASLAGLSESEKVEKLRAQVLDTELKLRDYCSAAKQQGAEEMRQELEPRIEETIQLYDEMRLARQKAAQSAVEAWTEAQKVAALSEEESRVLTDRVQELETQLQQSRKKCLELSQQGVENHRTSAAELAEPVSSDMEPAGEQQEGEEEQPVNMDHARQFVVDKQDGESQASGQARAKTPQPGRAKTPTAPPRSKTPRVPRSKTPSAPRARTPPEGGRRGGRFSLNAICSAPSFAGGGAPSSLPHAGTTSR